MGLTTRRPFGDVDFIHGISVPWLGWKGLTMNRGASSLSWVGSRRMALVGAAALAAGCGGSPVSSNGISEGEEIASAGAALTAEDGLAEAYALFKQTSSTSVSTSNSTSASGFTPGSARRRS
jgi:hypothetical protein